MSAAETTGNFAKLALEPKQIGMITRIFEGHIRRSLVMHPMLIITKFEVRRRFGILDKAFKACRGDLKFSIERACDEAGIALNKSLRGESWEPSKRATYSPDTKVEVRQKQQGVEAIQTEMKETANHGSN